MADFSRLAVFDKEVRRLFESSSRSIGASGSLVMPSVLLERYRDLDLSPLQVLIVLYLLETYLGMGSDEWPTRATMAERFGVTTTTIGRQIADLKAKGFLETCTHTYYDDTMGYEQWVGADHFYDVSKLFDALAERYGGFGGIGGQGTG